MAQYLTKDGNLTMEEDDLTVNIARVSKSQRYRYQHTIAGATGQSVSIAVPAFHDINVTVRKSTILF